MFGLRGRGSPAQQPGGVLPEVLGGQEAGRGGKLRRADPGKKEVRAVSYHGCWLTAMVQILMVGALVGILILAHQESVQKKQPAEAGGLNETQKKLRMSSIARKERFENAWKRNTTQRLPR